MRVRVQRTLRWPEFQKQYPATAKALYSKLVPPAWQRRGHIPHPDLRFGRFAIQPEDGPVVTAWIIYNEPKEIEEFDFEDSDTTGIFADIKAGRHAAIELEAEADTLRTGAKA